MKNLKKLMSVILTVAMLMSFAVSTSAASFADVEETSAAYEAIEVLAALDILEGKEAGNFDPDANIKRSEFAAVICRAMNAEAAAAGSSASFVDVAADHWAAGYIGWAAGSGIVNGKGDGKFDPDANVTYQEAVTMIIRAMGFDPLAIKRGGFPTGYMAIANTYNITTGVAMAPATGAATRAGVAQLVYNAFDAPLMDASTITFSDDEEYTIFAGKQYTGSYDERRTLLSQYHGIYKVKADVEDTFRSDATNLIKATGDKYVELKVTNVNGLYKFPYDQIFAELGITVGTAFDALANDDALAKYLGYTVNAYIALNADGVVELVAMVPDSKSIETLEIANPKAQISAIVLGDGTNKGIVEYWANADDSKATTVSLPVSATGVTFYVNGTNSGALNTTDIADIKAGDYSSIILMGKKANGNFDKVMATQYKYSRVEEVDVEAMTISTDYTDYVLNPDDLYEEFSYTIWKDGVEIALSDIAEGDILNVISDDADGDFSNDYFADIYVSDEVIEASVGEVSTPPTGVVYKIDGVEYTVANGASVTLNAGDAGKFFLTIDGYLYDAELAATRSGNYAFVLGIGLEKGVMSSNVWKIKMLTKDNEVVTLDVKTKAKINGLNKTTTNCTGVLEPGIDDPSTAVDESVECTCEQCAALEALYDAVTTPDPATADDRLITYAVSGDEITAINFAGDYDTVGDRVFNVKALTGTGTYNANTERLDTWDLLANTVIFNAPFEGSGPYTLNEDKVQVYTVSSLEDNTAYDGYAFDINADRAMAAALITENMGFAGKANALAVVKSVSTGLDAAGNSTDIINFFQAGEMKSLAVTNEAYIGSVPADTLTAGDIIQYTTNIADEINNLTVIFDMNGYIAEDLATVPPVAGQAAYSGGTLYKTANTDANGTTYDAAVVTDITNKYVKISSYYGWDLDEAATNVLFDVAKAGSNLNSAFAAKTGTGYIKATADDGTKYTKDAYLVVAKIDDGNVVEVVAYKYAKNTAKAGIAITIS